MKQIYIIPFFLCLFMISGCTSNKAIRGGAVVKGYPIAEIGLPIEEVHYKNLDGTALYAWFIKKENHCQLPTIIFLHGSRGNILTYLPVIKNLYQTIDANILACDFPGTGASSGEMGLESSYQMTLAAIDYLTTERNISQDTIVLYGASMGASLAFYGASKREHVMVIVDSGVTSASDYLKKYTLIVLPDFFIGLFGENFDNYPLVRSLKNPKLFLHATDDRFTNIKDAQKLYDQAAGPKDFSWVKGNHVLFGDPDKARELSKKVQAFLGAHIPNKAKHVDQ